MTKKRPTTKQFETAAMVLLWLHENCDSGADRDEISYARFLLDEESEARS